MLIQSAPAPDAATAGDAPRAAFGEPIPRVEDARLLRGHGRYTDDVVLPGMVHAAVVRSPHAHARIRSIDVAAAAAAPGVVAVFTAADLARERIGGLPCRFLPVLAPGASAYRPEQPLLVRDRVRHVGDRVALVVAVTPQAARDAAEAVAIGYEPLDAVSLESASKQGAPAVWADAPDNVSFRLARGDARAAADAIARADHVTRLAVRYPRVSANPIEPRSSIGVYDPGERRYTLYASTQAPHRVKEVLCPLLGLADNALRVVAPDIGGAFGMKGQIYPEDALVLWAAGRIGRPVKWTADRSESFMSDMHGRDLVARAELALRADGRILALRVAVEVNVGAYLGYSGGVSPTNAAISYSSVYDIPAIHAEVKAVFTHTAPIGPYRGSGKPEANYVTERIVDKAAREMGLDPVAVRRMNLVTPAQMPYRTPGGFTYDCGDFPAIFERALERADWRGFADRRAASGRRGVLRGIGIGLHCQCSGNQSERMEIRVAVDGSVAIYAGTVSTGQGHETMFAQMASGWLGVPLAHIRVFQGDTDRSLYGRGSYAQRSMIAGGSALRRAADAVIDKGRRLAAFMMEAAVADIEFAAGRFLIRGTDRALKWPAVAQRAYAGAGLPPELGIGLDGVGAHPGPFAFPNGCIVCEVEVDPATGRVTPRAITSVDDVGAAVNPLTLAGQLHGAIAQGLGEALGEDLRYDRHSGQLVTGTFMDYAMPRADDVPPLADALLSVPTAGNDLGVKGGSEAGNVGAPAAIINAIVDALHGVGVDDVALPATSERVWRAIRARSSDPSQHER